MGFGKCTFRVELILAIVTVEVQVSVVYKSLGLGPRGLGWNPRSFIYELCDLGQVTSPFWACFLSCEV